MERVIPLYSGTGLRTHLITLTCLLLTHVNARTVQHNILLLTHALLQVMTPTPLGDRLETFPLDVQQARGIGIDAA